MYNFIKKFSIFIIISFLVYYIIGTIIEINIESNLKNNQYQLQEDWHIKHADYKEFLFIGNSRTWMHIDIAELSNKIKKSYCLAQNGRDSRVLFYKLKKYLEINRKPKRIFMQFDPYVTISSNDGTFWGKESYLAYIYHDRLGINKIFENEIGFSKADVYLPLRRYFTTEGGLSILRNHFSNSKPPDHKSYTLGSVLQNRSWSSTSNWSNPEKTDYKLNFIYIDSIVDVCNLNNIKLTLLYPPQSFPSYKRVDNKLIINLKLYALKNKIEFWNFNNIKYNNISFFWNHIHLNSQGSKIYTKDLIDSIKFSK